MMPFRKVIAKNLEILASYEMDMIAPSHGQVYDKPEWILEAYRDWVLYPPHNLKVEVLEPVLCKGKPDEAAFTALDRLANAIAQKHRENGFQ